MKSVPKSTALRHVHVSSSPASLRHVRVSSSPINGSRLGVSPKISIRSTDRPLTQRNNSLSKRALRPSLSHNVASGVMGEGFGGNVDDTSFPFWVLPVQDLLLMRPGEHDPHEQLLKQGKLVKWVEGMGPVMMLSSERLGFAQVDPHFEQ